MMSTDRITILLIDDEAMIRAGLRALLESTGNFIVVGETGDARNGIEKTRDLQPDVVLLDIAMPGLSGLDAVEPIKQVSPATKVLIASQHEGYGFVRQALKAGADGYVSKASDPEELGAAIESVLRGESFLSPRVSASPGTMRASLGGLPAGSALQKLTAREREVFQLIAIGRANKQIAAVLGVSLATVKKHRENLQRKLDCHSAAELARLAIREGLLDS
jgi:DNA-binding NarL/FixJ family response regulator